MNQMRDLMSHQGSPEVYLLLSQNKMEYDFLRMTPKLRRNLRALQN